MKIGSIAFLVGLVIAVVGAFVSQEWFPIVLVVTGLVVGFLNVSGGESRRFLISAIAFLMAADALDTLPMVGAKVTDIMLNIGYMVGAAALLVAIISLFDMSKD
ncbi:hypothetical protein [Kangiella sp. HZ709]|uniref:hypothetical protein n=1 Tax=Kangiella sp. HZ709 TaxID=2666328 RepID=UPI0012B157A6|nr:hypothetical protein [Kangiella sp. HZ709]MRX28270.1 hypothetical protein [Kangiella sp. HZ709]